MKVYVKLFAGLRAQYPHVNDYNPLELDVEKGTTIEEIIDLLNLPKQQVHFAYIDGIKVDIKTQITKDGCTVALFPAIAGG